jgi:hypothetical protein
MLPVGVFWSNIVGVNKILSQTHFQYFTLRFGEQVVLNNANNNDNGFV